MTAKTSDDKTQTTSNPPTLPVKNSDRVCYICGLGLVNCMARGLYFHEECFREAVKQDAGR